jgi:hypothetical protein
MPSPIDKLMPQICVLAAEAVFRYDQISCEEPGDHMPEYFVSSYIFDHLKSGFAMTLETSFRILRAWDDQMDKPAGGIVSANAPLDTMEEMEVGAQKGRSDLVLFPENSIMIVEFKRHFVFPPDREKILYVLSKLKHGTGGAICSILPTAADSEWIISEHQKAAAAGDQCFVKSVQKLKHCADSTYTIFARSFAVPR